MPLTQQTRPGDTTLHSTDAHATNNGPTDSLLRQAMLSVTNERISIVDKNGMFLAVTPAVLKAWKTTNRKLLTSSLPQLIGNACYKKYIEKDFQNALNGKSGQVEFWYNANNTDCLYSSSLSPFYTAPNLISGVIIHTIDLTEKHKVETQLTTAKQRLTDFAQATSDWHWEMDAELKFTWISSAYSDFYGVDPSSLYGKHRNPLLETEQEHKAWEQHCKLLESQKPFRDYEFRIHTSSGIGWSRTSGVPVFSNGKFCGYRGTARDVTEIKEAELKAIRAESRFLHAIDEFPGSFALFDENERLVVNNRRHQQIFKELGEELAPGLSYESCLRLQLKKKIIDLSPECEEQWIQQRLRRFRHPEKPEVIKNGDNRWYRISEHRLPDGGCLKTMLDITEQQNAELAIKEERNLLRSLIDSIPHMIYAKNTDLEFTVINKATADFYGQSTDLAEHEKPGDKDSLSTHSRSGLFDRQVIYQQRKIKNHEQELVRESDGEKIWVSTSKSPLYDIKGNIVGLVGTSSDITASKTFEKNLLRSEARFRDFAETAADWFWEMDANRKVSYLSERYEEITGADITKLISTDYLSAAKFLIPDDNNREKFIQCIENSLPFSDLQATICTNTGERRHFYISGKPWFDDSNNFCGFRGAGRDVTSFRRLENQLSYQASHDELTGLVNRREFMERLDQLVKLSQQSNTHAVLGYLDLDQFKVINDTAGHGAGDQLLIQVTQLLNNTMRKGDTLARLGGDEFGILLHDTDSTQAQDTMRRVISQIEEIRFPWEDNLFSIGGSVGLVTIDDNNDSSTELLSKADLACYSAKDAGRGTCRFYHAQNDELIQRRSQLLAAASITEAIQNDRLILYAQPIYPINQTEQVQVHYEILLRMLDDQDQLIFPGAFIPAAERYDLMARIDRWVISKSLQQIKSVFHPDCSCGISINLSGQSLSDSSLVGFVKQQLELNGISPSRICFEITETAAISNFNFAQNFINTMKSIGCTFALDDFGSGLSSFGYLKHFKVDYLKIDGSFVRNIVSDPTDRVMVTSINQVGKLLGMKTIAEFVENQEIMEVLTDINVDFVQGYAVGKPQEFNRKVMFPGS